MGYILLITEDKDLTSSLKAILGKEFIVDGVMPVNALKAITESRPTAIFLDSQLTMDSRDLLVRLLEYDPTLTVIKIVSSFGTAARQAIGSGVFDMVEKPLSAERITHLINKAVEREKLLKENIRLREDLSVRGMNKITDRSENGEHFFQELFQTITENFPDIDRTGVEILKTLKRRFYFNKMLLLLKEKETFITSASLGIEESILSKVEAAHSHPLIMWLLGKNRILNLATEKDLPFDCNNFMDILKCRIAFPLRTFDGRLIGVFLAGDKLTGVDTTFADISFLSTTMDYLATVFDNLSLYREVAFRKDSQESIFKNIPIGIIAVDTEGKVEVFNPYAETIFGLKSEEVMGKPVEKVGSQIADFIRRSLISGEVFDRVEINYVPSRIILGLSTNLIKNGDGVRKGAVAIFHDLTFVKEMENKEKEVEKNRYWNLLASRLSHELKNPLVAIKTFAQMLPLKYNDEEFRTKFSDVMQGEVQRINEIIDRINKLAYSMELRPVEVDVVELFRSKIKEVEKGDSLRFNIEGSSGVFVPIDPEKFKEAIGYIFDFIHEDTAGVGEARICFENTDKDVEVTISENGNRINLTDSEDFFVPFNSKTRSPVSIGMVLTRKILESHGGSFKCVLTLSARNLVISLPKNGEKNG
jgi:PAS domain S-box-containing protein